MDGSELTLCDVCRKACVPFNSFLEVLCSSVYTPGALFAMKDMATKVPNLKLVADAPGINRNVCMLRLTLLLSKVASGCFLRK